MKVLSLFDGISCGRVALERVGVVVEVYHAYEIDERAKEISKYNYPDIVHFGDVAQCSGIDYYKENFDLLIGGSPCQDLSIAKQNREGLDGQRSSLFFEYLRVLEEMNPKYFLYENVESMSKEDKDTITNYLGVEPIMIDSALVSAQRRKRLYWTNIPNVTLPKDEKILLKDILDPTIPFREIPSFAKGMWGDTPRASSIGWIMNNKANTLTTNRSHTTQYYFNEDKSLIRLLEPREWEKLQTLPIGYTSGFGKQQACKGIGNGWTVDVIAHIFKGLK